MGSKSVEERAMSAGLEMVKVGDRVEARMGSKVMAFHTQARKALEKALERIEEDRLREVDKRPEDREPVIVATTKKTPAPVVERTAAPAPVAAPSMVDPPLGPPMSRSIIKSKYKDRYKAKGYSCGDEIAEELALYIKVVKNAKLVVDVVKLREVAEKNGVWKESYARLNIGQQRMNIGNRLRVKYAEGDEIDIGGSIFKMKFD